MEKILNYKLTTNLGDETYKKIIIIDNELMPADYQLQGTVVILKPKRDLKLYNYAYGRSEGDLMNVDYHKIDLFRKIEKNGYDGVVIHDFAQSNYWGNIGHIAYGLFPNTIKDLNISSIKKQTHPINENQTEEKNKTIVLYRGEYTGNIGGQFYSPDKEWARQFTQSGLDREIKTIKIKESDIYNSTAYAGDPDEVHAAIAKARAAGKRAVRLDEGHGQPKSVKIFDPSILQNTTKQSPISKPVSFARWLQSAVDTRGLVGAHKTEQTMAGTVDDWLLHPSLREQFKEQLELPVIIDPKLKMTILGIARKNQGNLGRHVVISPRANEEVFIHELIHHKNPALSEDEVKAKGSELLPNLYKQSL